MTKRLWIGVFLCTLGVALWGVYRVPRTALAQSSAPSWPQWAQNPQHTGFLNIAGQNLNQNLANIVYDPLVPQETAANGGDLLVHYQTPLVDGNDVFMESKGGHYNKNSYSTETWHQNRFSWINGQLTKIWTFDSDWVAPGSQNDFWEPVYHAVLANGVVYDPGAGGTIFKLNRADGSVVARLNPFGTTIDKNTFTASPLTTDGAGNIYYNIVQLAPDASSFYAKDVVNSWLVKVSTDDSISTASYGSLFTAAVAAGVVKGVPAGEPLVPGPNDPCKVSFPQSEAPFPPSPDATPPTTACGSQRAALNIAPAIAPDGTIYTVSRAHFVSRYNYLIAVNPNLTIRWAASLRGRLHDGCETAFGSVPDSILPPDGQPGGCRVGAHDGVDPGTNEPGPGRVLDDASSTPTVAPDGSILFGAYTRYNYAQGHLMHFSANGDFLQAFPFGWDSTTAIFQHGDTYSIVIKNNHYSGLGSYCNVATVCPTDRTSTNPFSPEAFFVTQLDPSLNIEWSFQNTNTLSCVRNADGSVTCVDNGSHPHSFEWCVNAPVVDRRGTVFANSEDGFLYAINQGGTLKQRIFQQLNIGAAYTPASLGSDGKIYSQNAGHMFVVGN